MCNLNCMQHNVALSMSPPSLTSSTRSTAPTSIYKVITMCTVYSYWPFHYLEMLECHVPVPLRCSRMTCQLQYRPTHLTIHRTLTPYQGIETAHSDGECSMPMISYFIDMNRDWVSSKDDNGRGVHHVLQLKISLSWGKYIPCFDSELHVASPSPPSFLSLTCLQYRVTH